MSAFSLSCQIPLKHSPQARARLEGGDLTLNSLLRAWFKSQASSVMRSLQAARVYGQVQSVFLMNLNDSFANPEPRATNK